MSRVWNPLKRLTHMCRNSVWSEGSTPSAKDIAPRESRRAATGLPIICGREDDARHRDPRARARRTRPRRPADARRPRPRAEPRRPRARRHAAAGASSLGLELRALPRLPPADLVLHLPALPTAGRRRAVPARSRRGDLHALVAEGLADDEGPEGRRRRLAGDAALRAARAHAVRRLLRVRRA